MKKRIARKRTLLEDASRLLVAAAVLLDSPRRWTRRAYALDGRGRSICVDNPRAARFCLAGALLRAEHNLSGAPCPVRTSEAPDVDDLLLPILPEGAPARLTVALSALAIACGWQLEKLGVRYQVVEPDHIESAPIPTTLHRPLLLGLYKRAHFTDCEWALSMALSLLDWIARDDERLDRMIHDEVLAR